MHSLLLAALLLAVVGAWTPEAAFQSSVRVGYQNSRAALSRRPSLLRASSPPPAPVKKSRLDLDGDGEITREELREAPLTDVLFDLDTFKEVQRTFRRTVYGHPEWVEHRNSQRWGKSMKSILSAGVAREVWKQVVLVTAVALALVLYNDYSGDVLPDHPILSMPTLAHTISSPALSLLLVFRTNNAYARWWEARKVWGSVINTSRDLARMMMACIPSHELALMEKGVSQSALWSRCLTYHLRKPSEKEDRVLLDHLQKFLSAEDAQHVMSKVHKPMTMLMEISKVTRAASVNVNDKVKIDTATTQLMNDLGKCERIFKTPIPLVYSRHSTRFLGVWLLSLPLALYGTFPNHWAIVPISTLVSFFYFGIEELGISIEEPFSILPMEIMSNGIEASIMEAFQSTKQDIEKATPVLESQSNANTEISADVAPLLSYVPEDKKAALADILETAQLTFTDMAALNDNVLLDTILKDVGVYIPGDRVAIIRATSQPATGSVAPPPLPINEKTRGSSGAANTVVSGSSLTGSPMNDLIRQFQRKTSEKDE